MIKLIDCLRVNYVLHRSYTSQLHLGDNGDQNTMQGQGLVGVVFKQK